MAQQQMPQAPRAPGADEILQPIPTTQSQGSSGPAASVEAALEVDLQQIDGQDDEDELSNDTSSVEVDLTLAYSRTLGSKASFVSQVQLSTVRFSDASLETDDDEFSYDLERLYLQLRPSRALRLRLGRQNFEDAMETIYDEDLDGLAIRYDAGRTRLQLSLTREDLFEASTSERDDEITNAFASLTFEANKNSFWMPFVLTRTEKAFAGNPAGQSTWAGLQGIVEPASSAFRYWVNGMYFTGERRDDDDEQDIDLGGFAIDVGFNLFTSGAWTFTAAAQQASGGSRDKRFRQTGLQGNDFALNDKNEFRYLGEALDPELTNIRILTLGIGVEFGKQWLADVAVHQYQQVEKEDAIRGSDLEFDPLGTSDDLGTGVDLVVSWLPSKSLSFIGTASTFMPGDAFADGQDPATLFKLEIDYEF